MRGKHVVITGAGGGIGRAVAEAFGAAGSRLCLADIKTDAVAELVSRLNARAIEAVGLPLDISDRLSVRQMVVSSLEAFGPIDVLVHCAGLDAPRGRAWDLPDEDHWLPIIDLDLNGAWRCASAVVPHMTERGRGKIILIGSVAGRQGSSSASVAYSAAKAGVHGMTMALARQLEAKGILVNAIAPGPTGTGESMSEEELALDRSRFVLPIVGAAPVAMACLYLAGDGGDWISGTILNVSGGRWYG